MTQGTDGTETSRPIGEIVGEGADKPEAQPEPQTSEAPAERADDKSWTYAALKDERSKRQALQERLAELEAERSLRQQAEQQQQPGDDFWANPEAAIDRRVHAATQQTKLRASRAEFIAENGRGELEELEGAVARAMQARDPDMAILAQEMRASDDPVGVAMQWYRSTQGSVPQRRSGPVYPSNLAGARNVGSRSGPAWSGPTPLDDIFDRRGKR